MKSRNSTYFENFADLFLAHSRLEIDNFLIKLLYIFQREAKKLMLEKFTEYAGEQKSKIEGLGIIQQKKGGKRKRKH